MAPGEQVVEIGLLDDYSFCRSCRVAIPASERISREARLRAAREAGASFQGADE